jgi:hypothetical protein
MLLAAILLGSVRVGAVTVNKAMLQHNGEVTLFDGSNMQAAVDAAQDGDTIFLTLGTFDPFTISKKITIRGTGETSIINGDVTINIPYSPTLESPLLESLAVSGEVILSAKLSNLLLRKCKISGGLSLNSAVNGGTIERCQIGGNMYFIRYVNNTYYSGAIENFYIDRCNISNSLILRSNIKSMTVMNSIVSDLSSSESMSNNTTFVNCLISKLRCNNLSATFINSILWNYSNNNTINSSVLLNSLVNRSYLSIGSSSVTQNCYLVSNPSTTTTDLQYNGYLGTDGTIVGHLGGSTPYSDVDMFKPLVPTVTSSDIKLDNENKVLNVKLTVSPQ